MRLLTNFPLEMFGPREEYPFDRILSFGPAAGRAVGDERFAYDVVFDAARGTLDELLARLPADFTPDCLMLWWPDQEPMPEGLERCPCPVIGVVSDYNLRLPHLLRTWPFFDLLLCDHPGLQVLGRLPFARVEPWCQFSFRPDVHRIYENEQRDIDLSFVANLNPVVQRERMPWIHRVEALAERWNIFVGTAPQGEPYGRLLSRSRIVFNRSVRGEINLRCFEATAAGACLLAERENTEIRSYFEPDEEVVLYGPEDLEAKVTFLLTHEDERERIAQNGHRRVQDHRLARLFEPIPGLIAELDPAARPFADEHTLAVGRAEAMLAGYSAGTTAMEPLVAALRACPESLVATNDLAVTLVTCAGDDVESATWLRLFDAACARSPSYLPARLNLLRVFACNDYPDEEGRLRDETRAVLERDDLALADFDGLCIPLGFTSHAVTLATAWCEALRRADTTPLRTWFRTAIGEDGVLGPSKAFTEATQLRHTPTGA